MQPHPFLPHEFPGNERIRCGSGIMAPINLSPWIERDPFNKEADFDLNNLIEPQVALFLTDNSNSVTHSTTTLSPSHNLGHFNDVTFTVGKPHPTSRPNAQIVSNNIDFSQVAITPKPSAAKPVTTTKKPTMTISNKVDFSTFTSTTKRKRKTTIATKRPNSTIVDNKIDFSTMTKPVTTKRPSNSPFSKTNANSTIVRRSTDKKKKKPDESVEHRSDLIDLTDTDLPEPNNTETRQKTFRNEDNATKYLDNKAVLIESGNKTTEALNMTEEIESRVNYNYYSGSTGNKKQYDNYYNYNNNNDNNAYRPSLNMYSLQRPNNNYYPLYPPLNQPGQTTSKRPVSYQNNRPNYDMTNNRPRPDENVVSPISNKLSTPFSYDTNYYGPTNGPTFNVNTPNMNYENMAIPLYVSPNRYNNKRPTIQYFSNRHTYATTKKADFSTFLIVETTRRTSPVPQHYFINADRTTKRPFNKDFSISSSHLLQSLFPITPVENFYSSNDYEGTDQTNLTYLISTSATNNKKFTNKPTHVKLSSYKPSSIYSDYSYNPNQDNDFDGYLRPENNFYSPLANKYKVSYNDYTNYNYKPETSTVHTVKYFFKKNVLHKYHTIKSGEPKEGELEDKDDENEPTKRYAELYDEHLSNDKSNDFVSLARTRLLRANTDVKKNEGNVTRKTDKKRHHFANTFFVPFQLLTRIERPDNWVNTKITDSDLTKTQLPDVPTINQDDNFARELPRPINFKDFKEASGEEGNA